MNNALIILTIVLVCIAIVLCVYLIITFRKIHIVSKKMDYLVEEIIDMPRTLLSVTKYKIKRNL